jgi:hypothetical protein
MLRARVFPAHRTAAAPLVGGWRSRHRGSLWKGGRRSGPFEGDGIIEIAAREGESIAPDVVLVNHPLVAEGDVDGITG